MSDNSDNAGVFSTDSELQAEYEALISKSTDALVAATLEMTGADSITFASEDGTVPTYVKPVYNPNRKFSRRDYRRTARYLRILSEKGVASELVTVMHDAHVTMFQTDSDATPVDGVHPFDAAKFTEGCMVS